MPNSPYRQVPVNALNKGRRGKHRDLIVGILRELESLPPDAAMEISLANVGIGLTNLRADVQRACNSRRLHVGTLADEKNFYVWKKK